MQQAEGVAPLLGAASPAQPLRALRGGGAGQAAGVAEGKGQKAEGDKGLCINLLAPLPGSTITFPASFVWQDFCGLLGFELWISTSDQFLFGSTWAFPAGPSGVQVSEAMWSELLLNIGPAPTYYWTVYMPEFGFTDANFGFFQVNLPACELTMNAPAANASVSFPATFSWSASGCQAAGLIITDGNGPEDLFVTIPVTGNSITLTADAMLANILPLRRVDTYYWGLYSVGGQVITDLRPFRAPSLCSAILNGPEPGAGVRPPARFSWTISGQCTQQFIYFYGGDPAPPFILTLPTTGNEYVLSPEVSEFVQLLYDPPYFWGVSQQAEVNGEAGVVSTSGPPRPLNLLEVQPCISTQQSPAHNAQVSLPATFTWSSTGDCPQQALIIATSGTPSEVLTIPQSSATSALLTHEVMEGLPLQDVYYWAVGYFLPEFNTSFASSEFRPFRVSNLACDLQLTSPASGAAVSFPAAFGWTQRGGCTVDRLLFSRSPGGTQPQSIAVSGNPMTISSSQWAAIASGLGLASGDAVYWSAANGSTALTGLHPFFVSEPPAARTRVTGIVTNGDTHTPMAGVAVDVARTVDGVALGRVSTGADGRYSYEAPNTISLLTLKFSAPGFQTLEFANTTPPAAVDARLFRARPDAPTGVVAKGGAGQNEVRWAPSQSPDVAGYNVYRSSGNLTFSKVNTALVQTPDFADTDTSNLKNYEYYVTAVSRGEQPLESEASAIARVQTNVIGVSLADVSAKGNGFVRIPVNVENAAGIRPKGTQISVRVPVHLIRRDYNQNGFEQGIKVEGTGVGAAFSFSENDNDPGLITVTSTSDALVPAGNGHIVDIAIATAPAGQETCGPVKLEGVTFVDKFSLQIAALISKEEAQLCIEGDCLQGDLTGDGIVNIGDAVRALAISVDNFTADECAYKAGDLNGDRVIDAGDSVTIQRIIQGKSINPAPDDHLLPKGNTPIVVQVARVEVEPGTTEVQVPVFVENAGAMAGADLSFAYLKDDAIIDLQDISKGTISAGQSDDTNVSKPGSGAISLSQANAVTTQARGTVAVLTFKLNKDIAPGTELPLRLAEAGLKGVAGDDLSWRADVELVSGAIVVKGSSLFTPQLLVSVVDDRNNQPITGANVAIGALPSDRAKEDVAGLYGWPFLTTGNYNVSVEATGYRKETTNVNLNASLNLSVRMQPENTPAGPWTLTVNQGTKKPNTATHPDGAEVTITANAPAAGKVFDRWTGDVARVADVSASPTTITMRANSTVTATYRDVPPPTLMEISPQTGSTAGGNQVTLTGTNLSGATSVNFGGVHVTPSGVSATQATVTAPAHNAGTVAVTITTSAGTSNAVNYTYAANGISVSPELCTVGAAAGTAQFTVTAAANAPWSISENANWIEITTPAGGNGTGSGTIALAYSENDGAQREAQITLNAPGSEPETFSFRVLQSAAVTEQPVVLGAISPVRGPVSGGTVVTLTGQNLSGVTAVDFGGSAATGISNVFDGSLTCVTPAHPAGAVEVRVMTAAGSSNALTFTYEAEGGDGGSGGCGCGGGAKEVKLEDVLADLLLGLMVATVLWLSNRAWRQH